MASPVEHTSSAFWPPRSGQAYDWELPTNEAYDDPKDLTFTSAFNEARRRLDYGYHKHPAHDRQELQDAILTQVTSSVDASHKQARPWIVFTAGPMGVGKSYAMTELHNQGLFPLDGFLKIDPDMLKSELPEMAGYLEYNSDTAATKLHRESCQMSDVLFEHALLNGFNLLVDGSLRDVGWYTYLFGKLREEHPAYRLAILHVSALPTTIRARAAKRAVLTGRAVPEELLQASIDQVPLSVATLAPLTDMTYEISNNDGETIQLTSMTGRDAPATGTTLTWASFERSWKEASPEDDAGVPEEAEAAEPVEVRCTVDDAYENAAIHEVARAIWGAAYPKFCPRCTLACGQQCGICIHEKHSCACDICRVCG